MGVLVVLGLVVAGRAEAQILPLISQTDSTGVAFWWSDPEAPQLTAFDDSLFDLATLSLIDPAGNQERPSVSAVYRIPVLTTIGARNLAGLYGARFALVGDVELGEAEVVTGGVYRVVPARLRYQLLSTDGAYTSVESVRQLTGVGQSSDEARLAALALSADFLSERVARMQARLSVGDPGEATVPTIVISGLEVASPLVAFKGDLRRHATVLADVWEAWATEGTIGLEVELQPGQGTDSLDGVLRAIASDSEAPYELLIGERRGLSVAVQLRQRAGPDGPEPVAPESGEDPLGP